MHIHFSGAGAASHTDVFKSAAKSRKLMSLEMRKGYDYIGLHYFLSYNGFFAKLSVSYGNVYLAEPLKSVADYYVAAR